MTATVGGHLPPLLLLEGPRLPRVMYGQSVPEVPQMIMDSANAYIYGPSGTPAEQVNLSTGAVTYLIADALGSVRGTVNNSGALTGTTSYDAWGTPQTTGGLTGSTPFGYAWRLHRFDRAHLSH